MESPGRISPVSTYRVILGVDASERSTHVGLRVVASEAVSHTYTATAEDSEKTIAAIEVVLESAGISLSEVTALSVCTGPGSFTGLRSALATIKGLSFQKDTPIVPVRSLESRFFSCRQVPRVTELLSTSPLGHKFSVNMRANRAETFSLPIIVTPTNIDSSVGERHARPFVQGFSFIPLVDEPFVLPFAEGNSHELFKPAPPIFESDDDLKNRLLVLSDDPICNLWVDYADPDFHSISEGNLGIYACEFAYSLLRNSEYGQGDHWKSDINIVYGKPVAAKTLAERKISLRSGEGC